MVGPAGLGGAGLSARFPFPGQINSAKMERKVTVPSIWLWTSTRAGRQIGRLVLAARPVSPAAVLTGITDQNIDSVYARVVQYTLIQDYRGDA